MPDEPQSVKSCLVLHGLGGGPYEVAPLIEGLMAAGVEVSAPILPGHEVAGPTMPASRWEDWAAAAEAAFDALADRGGPVGVLGFSTGSTLALRLATRRPVDRQVLLAPFLAIRFSGLVPFESASYLRQLAKVMPNVPRRSPAVRDAKARKELEKVTTFRTFNLRATLSALELIELVRPEVPKIEVPTAILQGKLDTVVEPGNAAWLLEMLGSKRKCLTLLKKSDHLLALDHDRDQVRAETLAFLLGLEVASPTR